MSGEVVSSCLVDPYRLLTNAFAADLIPVCPHPPAKPHRNESGPPAKKRKKEPELSLADVENRQLHAELVPWLAPAIARVRSAHLASSSATRWHGDGVAFVEAGKETASRLDEPLFSLAEREPDDKVVQLGAYPAAFQRYDSLTRAEEGVTRVSAEGAISAAYRNGSSSLRRLKVQRDESTETYLVPPRSAFLVARLDHWQAPLEAVVRDTQGIDLVILDPPWPNASASRSSSYETFDIYDLFRFDLPTLLKAAPTQKDTLVTVWLTNKPKFRRFVLDKLFPAWSITPVATNWFWVKITGLILGRYRVGEAHQKPTDPPDRQVFLSVPLEHSRKPPLLELLRPYLTDSKTPTVLELFARAALSGHQAPAYYIAAGDQALKFNNERHWISST